MEERTGKSKVVELHEAASLLDLSADAVWSLTAAGYLAPADHNGEPRYALGDLKAFVARNADDGSGIVWDDEGDALRLCSQDHCLVRAAFPKISWARSIRPLTRRPFVRHSCSAEAVKFE